MHDNMNIVKYFPGSSLLIEGIFKTIEPDAK